MSCLARVDEHVSCSGSAQAQSTARETRSSPAAATGLVFRNMEERDLAFHSARIVWAFQRPESRTAGEWGRNVGQRLPRQAAAYAIELSVNTTACCTASSPKGCP